MGDVVVNLGCGLAADPSAINVDRVALPGVDIVHDLDVVPWPLETGSADRVLAVQVFEHVHNPVGFMCEAHRILKPDGLLWMSVPHWKSENSFTDPTHVRHCTERTWDYWCEGTALYAQFNAGYGGVAFQKQSVRRYGDDLIVELVR